MTTKRTTGSPPQSQQHELHVDGIVDLASSTVDLGASGLLDDGSYTGHGRKVVKTASRSVGRTMRKAVGDDDDEEEDKDNDNHHGDKSKTHPKKALSHKRRVSQDPGKGDGGGENGNGSRGTPRTRNGTSTSGKRVVRSRASSPDHKRTGPSALNIGDKVSTPP